MIRLVPKDNIHFKVEADPSVLHEIADHFTFDVPGAKFMPAYKNKMWDGKIRLFPLMRRTLYLGLKTELIRFLEGNGYEVTDDISSLGCPEFRPETWDAFYSSLTLTARNEPLIPHDYQIEAVKDALGNGRCLLLSPTASGKSLMLYLMARWHHEQGRRQLLVVPTQSLVEQMHSDFADYSVNDAGWDMEEVQRIYAGHTKTISGSVVVSTWQSIFEMSPKFFAQFDVIYGDEAHTFKSKSLVTLMENTPNIQYRVGTTGTLDGSKTNKMVLEGLFGAVYAVTTTKTLMDEGQLASLSIKCVLLRHKEEDRKRMKKALYEDEIAYLISHGKRNAFIKNLALSTKKNTLILFQRVEDHGKVLYEAIRDAAPDRNIYFIHGKIPVATREEIRKSLEVDENAIVVASYGVYSTGINIRNLHNIIYASPSKSRIRNLQSIGRGLRLSVDKDGCVLYDIGDDISWKKTKNHTLRHMLDRIDLYSTEEFTYKVTKVDL